MKRQNCKFRATEYRIELKPGTDLVRKNTYRAVYKECGLSCTELRKILEAGIILPSDSEQASPEVLHPSSTSSCVFIDYWRLNALKKRDTYPLQRMEDYMDSIGEDIIFTTINANWGY